MTAKFVGPAQASVTSISCTEANRTVDCARSVLEPSATIGFKG
jgi:hypothetical protein